MTTTPSVEGHRLSLVEQIEAAWIVAGKNNDLPRSTLNLHDGDYVGEVYNACGDGQWCAVLNYRGDRGFESEDHAKRNIANRIKADVERRLKAAEKASRLYACPARQIAALPSRAGEDAVRASLRRVTDHLDAWRLNFPEDDTTETAAAIREARDLLAAGPTEAEAAS